jgi:hypothetical protein
MLGSDCCGKKQPALMNSLDANLSIDPISSISPSGSIKKLRDGLDICVERQVGEASITPPTRQKSEIYSSQVGCKDF